MCRSRRIRVAASRANEKGMGGANPQQETTPSFQMWNEGAVSSNRASFRYDPIPADRSMQAEFAFFRKSGLFDSSCGIGRFTSVPKFAPAFELLVGS